MSEELKPKEKRFSFSTQEKMRIENIESVLGIMSIQREGVMNSRQLALMEVRVRIGVKDSDAPKGYSRVVTYDSKASEIVVIDTPLPVNATPAPPAGDHEIPKTETVQHEAPKVDKKVN